MAILRIRDADGKVKEILALKGDKGDKGDPGEFTGGELLTGHINDRNNPHGATAEQIGAAPAGYGLGGYPTQRITSVAELDDAVKIGWYQFACMGAKIANMYFNYANVFVLNYVDSNSVFQEIRPVGTNIVIRRVRDQENSTWSEWEVENPPMALGVEYRTTERWNDKAVYVCLHNVGTLPNTGNMSVSVGGGIDRFVDYKLTAKSAESEVVSPSDADVSFGHNFPGEAHNSSWATITTKTDLSSYTAELAIKYVKV